MPTTMELAIQIGYSEIFDEPAPAIQGLLKKISSNSSIAVLSFINAQLYLDNTFDGQVKICRNLLSSQPETVRNRISTALVNTMIKAGKNVGLFSIHSSLEMLHYELLNYRESPELPSADDYELNFFKAYLIISEEAMKAVAPTSTAVGIDENVDTFRKMVWPIGLTQLQTAKNINPFTEIPRTISFFNFFEFNTPFSEYVKCFLSKSGKNQSWNYALDLVQLISAASPPNGGEVSAPCTLSIASEFRSLFELLTIDPAEYQKQFSKSKKNFTGIKSRPLFKLNEQVVVVLYWNFLAAKIFDSLIFDFYKVSGISAEKRFNDFLAFKRFVSMEVTEKFLLRKLISACFQPPKATILFDDEKGVSGFPDAYVREGKHIFLIEVKDALFKADVIDQPNYEKIKQEIDEKYGSDDKGVGQLVSQIEKLRNKPFQKDDFEKKIKRRNLVIYPVMIYTDRNFALPGVNKYLDEQFRSKLIAKSLDNTFATIKPLTFISLSFFIENIDLLSRRQVDLKTAINNYFDFINKWKKQKTKTRQQFEQRFHNLQETFEHAFYEKFKDTA
jgi:hypothetical protein